LERYPPSPHQAGIGSPPGRGRRPQRGVGNTGRILADLRGGVRDRKGPGDIRGDDGCNLCGNGPRPPASSHRSIEHAVRGREQTQARDRHGTRWSPGALGARVGGHRAGLPHPGCKCGSEARREARVEADRGGFPHEAQDLGANVDQGGAARPGLIVTAESPWCHGP